MGFKKFYFSTLDMAEKKIISNFGFLLFGTLLSRLFLSLNLIILARQTGPEYYGKFATIYSLAWLTSPLFTWGLDNWLIGLGTQEPASQDFIVNISNCILIKVIFGIIWCLILIILISFLNIFIFPLKIVILIVSIVWIDEIQRSVIAAFKAVLENKTNFFLMSINQGFIFLGTGVLALKNIENLIFYLYIWLGVSTFDALLSFGVLYYRFGFTPQPKQICITLKKSIPFALSEGLAMIYGRIDISIIAVVLGPIAAGLYSPAVSLINALALIPATAYFVFLPIFRQILSTNVSAFRRAIFTGLIVGLLGGAFLGISVWGIAIPLIRFLYGPAYEPTGHILVILSGVLFARTLNLILAAGIIVLNYQYQRVIVQVIAAIFNIVLNLLIINRWEIWGVAFVFVATEWLLVVAYLWLLYLAFQKINTKGVQTV